MSEVSEKIWELAQFAANKGIPPFLLASNITEANYSSVRLWKESGSILVEMACTDVDTGDPLLFLYRYDRDSVLQRIEMNSNGYWSVFWDRQEELAKHAEAIRRAVNSEGRSTSARVRNAAAV